MRIGSIGNMRKPGCTWCVASKCAHPLVWIWALCSFICWGVFLLFFCHQCCSIWSHRRCFSNFGDLRGQLWAQESVWKELCSWGELLFIRHLPCLRSELHCGFFATLKDASTRAQVQPRRNQLSLRLNFPNDQPDFTARSERTSCFATQSRSHFPQPEIWIFRIFIWATSFDLLQRYRENVKSTVAEQSSSLDRVQDTRSFGLLMEESTSCI